MFCTKMALTMKLSQRIPAVSYQLQTRLILYSYSSLKLMFRQQISSKKLDIFHTFAAEYTWWPGFKVFRKKAQASKYFLFSYSFLWEHKGCNKIFLKIFLSPPFGTQVYFAFFVLHRSIFSLVPLFYVIILSFWRENRNHTYLTRNIQATFSVVLLCFKFCVTKNATKRHELVFIRCKTCVIILN